MVYKLMRTRLPRLNMIEWLGQNRVRLFYAGGTIAEVALPVKSASRAKIVARGMGLDPGNGREMAAEWLLDLPGRILRYGRGVSRA